MPENTNEFDFTLSEEQLAIRDVARSIAETEIKSVVMKYDESEEFPAEIFKKLAEAGFLGVMVDEKYGGAGLGAAEAAIVIEEIARVDPGVALGVAAHNGLCTGHILKFGSEGQKKKYLPDLATGKKLGMWGLTEPGSGSDSGGMATFATRTKGGWNISGSKNFITHGTVGETAVIMAKTDKDNGVHGISAFILEKNMKGFSATKQSKKLGMRCSDTCTLAFDNVFVPEENLIGKEGDGFLQAMQVLDGGRISIAALSVGCGQGAYEAALKYSEERKQFGKPLFEHPAIQNKIAQMAMAVETSRLLTHKAAYLRDSGQPFSLEASQAKLFASESAVHVSEEAVQIHGGYGYMKEYPVEKFWRDSKLLTIGEGTSEVQRMVIAKHILE
ncbi:MAG TPA: acyl-CoA dehydrogenase family protein [Candidatus Kapabacteria bacterium]|nr:acyl-CoA dehydrogenase family protein [Candidatus Kapabacteria bacterium]